MPRGKQKGYKKERIVINDTSIQPFYIVDEDRQYVVMKEGTLAPYGYYTGLGGALRCIVRENNRIQNKGTNLTLEQYLNKYDELNNKILNTFSNYETAGTAKR